MGTAAVLLFNQRMLPIRSFLSLLKQAADSCRYVLTQKEQRCEREVYPSCEFIACIQLIKEFVVSHSGNPITMHHLNTAAFDSAAMLRSLHACPSEYFQKDPGPRILLSSPPTVTLSPCLLLESRKGEEG